MFKKFPNLSRFAVVIVLPLLIIAIYGYSQLKASILPYEGELQVAGLNSQVVVKFDSKGFARLSADTDTDAYFAQGFIHASERMWQMEMQRRIASGRLAEVFGQSAVPMDIWMRTLGLQQASESAWQHLDGQVKRALEAYSAGVNAWIEQTPVLSPQFLLLDIKPSPWQVTDSLMWQKVFALNLGLNLRQEIARLQGLKQLTPAQLNTFYPFDNSYDGIDELNGKNHIALAAQPVLEFTKDWHIGGQFVGSNAWAIAPAHTASGQAILANDPHLSVQQPSLWYGMAINGDKLAVEGMSLVGLPGIILGKNRHISWGAASLMADQQDLYVLDIPLGNPNVYLTSDGERAISKRRETIQIRAQQPNWLNNKIKPVTFNVRTTAIGPIVTDAIEGTGYDLALRWTALDPQDSTLEAFYQLQYASNEHEFKAAAAKLKNPGLQLLYADAKGKIGMQVAAHLPIRGSGDGTLPRKALVAQNHWQGYVDFSQLPSDWQAEKGYLVAANNLAEHSFANDISHEWAPASRKQRIAQLLEQLIVSKTPMTLAHMANLQQDQLDAGVQALLPFWLSESVIGKIEQIVEHRQQQNQLGQVSSETISTALQLMKNWQGQFNQDGAQGSIYFYWRDSVKASLFSPNKNRNQLNEPVSPTHLASVFEPQLLSIFASSSADSYSQTQQQLWCRDKSSCDELLADSFVSALDNLKQQTRTEDFAKWQWGQLHQVEYVARPFGLLRFVDGFVNLKGPVGGSANTINAANAQVTDNGQLLKTFGSSFRSRFDWGRDGVSGAEYSLPTGQSGHMLSRFYDNLFSDYYRIESRIESRIEQQSDKPVDDTANLGDTQLVLLPQSLQSKEH